MNIWIIYDGLDPNMQILAEKLADFLDDNLDVNVANSMKIEPLIILDETPEILIFGISVYNGILTLGNIKNWIIKFSTMLKATPINIHKIFNFGIGKGNISETEHNWRRFLLTYYKPHQISENLFMLQNSNFNGTLTKGQEKDILSYSKYIINKMNKMTKIINQR
jgi:menaquinone-dependent protoporphyrinogen IX oxidase